MSHNDHMMDAYNHSVSYFASPVYEPKDGYQAMVYDQKPYQLWLYARVGNNRKRRFLITDPETMNLAFSPLSDGSLLVYCCALVGDRIKTFGGSTIASELNDFMEDLEKSYEKDLRLYVRALTQFSKVRDFINKKGNGKAVFTLKFLPVHDKI